MNEMIIDFYDEIIKISVPNNFLSLKQDLANEYGIDLADVEELIIYFKEKQNKIFIKDELEFQKALEHFKSELIQPKNKNLTMTDIYKFFIEVSQNSKLYQKEFEHTKLYENLDKIENLKISQESQNPYTPPTKLEIEKYREQLRQEILEKEKQLKELLEKERDERERRLRLKIEKEKREEEEKLKQQIEKERLEKEEQDRKEKEILKEKLSKTIKDIVNKNLEEIKSELIDKTVQETSKVIEKTIKDPKIEKIPNLTVHRRVKCDGCGLFPIVGIRYKCTVCLDFDYCENCEEANGETHNHPFVKYRTYPWASRRFNCRKNPSGFFRNFNRERKFENQNNRTYHDRQDNEKNEGNHRPLGKFFCFLKDKFRDIFSSKENNMNNSKNCEFSSMDDKKNFNCEKKDDLNENIQNEKKENEKNYSYNVFEKELEEIRMMYDLSHISDERIIQALNQTGGEIIPALMLLF